MSGLNAPDALERRWESALADLARMLALSGEDTRTDAEALAALWEERAERIAHAPEPEDEGLRVALFFVLLGAEVYAFDAHLVRDVHPWVAPLRVPHVPPWVLGVYHWRGRMLTLVDVAAWLGLTPVTLEEAQVVVVEHGGHTLALCVDAALAVAWQSATQIQPASAVPHALPEACVWGIVPHAPGVGGELAVLLDLPAVLADARFVVE